MTAPGDLGLGRAYVTRRPGRDRRTPRRPLRGPQGAAEGPEAAACRRRPRLVKIVSGLGHLPPQAAAAPAAGAPAPLAPRRRGRCATRGRATREAIHHHYDVSNTFYEYVLGPSMTYTCAVYPTEDATLEQAQYYKYDLVARKLGLEPGMTPARRRLRLGRDGPARGRALRREGDRRDPVARAGHLGAGEDQGDGPRPPRRGAPQRLPRGHRVRLRRGRRRSG